MASTFGKDHDRLIREYVLDGNVAGYIIAISMTQEVLYAVSKDGVVKSQTQPLDHPEFGSPDKWEIVNECPVNAVYCGNYKI